MNDKNAEVIERAIRWGIRRGLVFGLLLGLAMGGLLGYILADLTIKRVVIVPLDSGIEV